MRIFGGTNYMGYTLSEIKKDYKTVDVPILAAVFTVPAEIYYAINATQEFFNKITESLGLNV